MFQAISVPSLQAMTQSTKEVGAVLTVLYVILGFGLAAIGVFLFFFGQKLDAVKELLVVHCGEVKTSDESALTKATVTNKDIQSFRDSEKDLLSNIKELIMVHAKVCETGQGKIAEVTSVASGHGKLLEKMLAQSESNGVTLTEALKDIDAIGRSLGELVAIVRDRIKEDQNDADRKA